MTVALDGHAQSSGTSVASVTATLTTANAGDVIVAVVGAQSMAGVQMSAAGVTGWTLQSQFGFSTSAQQDNNIQVWYGIAAAALTGVSVTAALGPTPASAAIVAFGVSGANTSKPFDSHVSLGFASGTQGTGFGSTPTTGTYSTTANAALVVTIGGSEATPISSAGAGFAMVDNTSSSGHQNVFVQSKVIAAALSSVTSAFGSSIGSGDQICFALAIVAAAETSGIAAPVFPMVDGANSGNAGSGTSVAAALTTGTSGDIVVACVTTFTTTTVTMTDGATAITGWTLKYSYNTTSAFVQVWQGKATGQLTADTVTASFSGTVASSSIVVFGISSGNPSAPFDANGSLPATATGSGFGAAYSTGAMTTTATKAMLLTIGGRSSSGSNNPNPPAPWKMIGASNFCDVAYTPVTSAAAGTIGSIGTIGAGTCIAGGVALVNASAETDVAAALGLGVSMTISALQAGNRQQPQIIINQ